MVIVMKPGTRQEDVSALVEMLETRERMPVEAVRGADGWVLNLLGDTKCMDRHRLEELPGVERVMQVPEPFQKAGRRFHSEDSVVTVGGVPVGGGSFAVMAGPCSVENGEQVIRVARAVKDAGAVLLRGGAFKPRTSPYAFQGMGPEGLDLLLEARKETGLPIVSEIVSPRHCEIFEEKVDLVQIGARNMQNFDLLKEVGRMSRPVLLKRGLSATYEEWLMSAEYIMAAGNENIILCERGIRTFETGTRNTFDVSAIPVLKRMSHLPVVVDPSHAGGYHWLVEPLAMAAIAAGADGLIVEVHDDPEHALSDGQQSLTPEKFRRLMDRSAALADLMGKKLVK